MAFLRWDEFRALKLCNFEMLCGRTFRVHYLQMVKQQRHYEVDK